VRPILVESANALADLLEVSGRSKGLRHPRHLKTVTKGRSAVEKVIAGYFRRQSAAVLKAIRPKIGAALQLHPPPLQEAMARLKGVALTVEAVEEALRILTVYEAGQKRTPEAKQFASTLLPSSMSPLRFPATAAETSEYDDAISAAIAGAAATAAKELKTDATINDTASSRYLRDNSLAKLTGNLQGETVDRLRGALADAWEAGGSADQVVAAVKATFADFSDTRAEMIAQTEVNDAYNYGRVELATEAGFDEKAWDPDGDACEEICQPNVDAGWIDIDEEFPSGDDAPTAHPFCDCGISFRKSTDSDE
jgi:hypothetical protein